MKAPRRCREGAAKLPQSDHGKMAIKKQPNNPLLDLPRVGPKEAAQIFGWTSPSTWRRNLPEMPNIRTVSLLKGDYYILEDVLRARYPEKNDQEIERMVIERENMRRSNHRPRREWIGPSEAARIAGWRSPKTWKRHLGRLRNIRKKKTRRGMVYDLGDVFAAIFPQADQERLNVLILDYKLRRAERNLKRKHRRRND